MRIRIGLKSDPIESRYTFDWLFGLMNEHGIEYLQYGSSDAAFCVEDEYFRLLRRGAERRGIRISSLFTAHREFGGFASGDPYLEAGTRRLWERIIEVAALLGAESAGSNACLIPRDRPEMREHGIARFFHHAKELMVIARTRGLKAITVETMSSVWEIPSTPKDVRRIAQELEAFRAADPESRVPLYFLADISHGLADEKKRVVHDNWEMFEQQIPWMWEFHFKNTDAIFNSTFGFGPQEAERGIVDLARLAALIERNAARFPHPDPIGYLEISGPKVGRDYGDGLLGAQLAESIKAVKRVFG